MAEFGEQLKKAREAKGITQQSLADKVYVTRQTISRWESGASDPSTTNLMALAKLFGVEAEELLKETKECFVFVSLVQQYLVYTLPE